MTQSSPLIQDPMLPQSSRVVERVEESKEIVTLVLEPPKGDFAFLPGQFNMLYSFGIGEVPISISGPTSDTKRVIHTIRNVGLATKALCDTQPGEFVGLRGPFGSHWPVPEKGNDVVIMAGGIGIIPLRPLIYEIINQRANYGKVTILYGSRQPTDFVFEPEIAKWKNQGQIETLYTVDFPSKDWSSHVGVVTDLLKKVAISPASTTAYVCGPEIMMRFSAQQLAVRSIPAEKIYLSMERNMKCAIGLCGHCQYGSSFICKDGAVFAYDQLKDRLSIKEL